MIAYHVDRAGTIPTGPLESQMQINGAMPETNCFISRVLADGISQIGYKYLAPCSYQNPEITVYISEAIIELVREQYFPHIPSRMQSIFAAETLEEANAWYNRLSPGLLLPNARIRKIEYSNAFKFDAVWRDMLPYLQGAAAFSLPTLWGNAHHYWSGDISSEKSRVELLIPLPVTVLSEKFIPELS